MQASDGGFTPKINRPIAGWRAYLGCLLVWAAGSVLASELTAYATGGGAPVQSYGPLSALVGHWEYAAAIVIAAVPIVFGEKRLRVEKCGRLSGRLVTLSGDFLLSLAAMAGVFEALGGAALVVAQTDPFLDYAVLAAATAIGAVAVALVSNEIRFRRFFTNLYQISMM